MFNVLIGDRQSFWEATSSLVDHSAHPTEPPTVEGVQWSIGGFSLAPVAWLGSILHFDLSGWMLSQTQMG
jgi:hypothetical protein